MDIDALRYFVEVCRIGTLTHAADKLCVTQQAVSRKIIMLEEELGVSLFLRTKRGMVPTANGLMLREKAEAILDIKRDILASVGASIHKQRGRFRVGFSPGTLFTLGIENLMQLLEGYDDWQFDFDEYSDLGCEARVLDGSIDFAFTISPKAAADLAYRSICRDHYVVLMGKEHPLAGRSGITLADVARYPQIALDDSFRMQDQLLQRFREMGLLPQIRTRINHDLTIAYDLIADNKSVFVFVKGLISEAVMQRNACLPLMEPRLCWDIGLIAKPDLIRRFPFLDQLVRACRDFQKPDGSARAPYFPG